MARKVEFTVKTLEMHSTLSVPEIKGKHAHIMAEILKMQRY